MKKHCLWHECDTEFTPEHNRQQFCSKPCQIKRGRWKALRGALLVDPLLTMNTEALEQIRVSLRKEIETCLTLKRQNKT